MLLRVHRFSGAEPEYCKPYEASRVKDVQRERQKLVISLGHKRKKITSWQSPDLVFARGVPRNQCSAFTLFPMKTTTLWRMKTNRAGGCTNIGVRFLRRALKASVTTAMRLFCVTFRRLLMTYVWKSTEMNLTTKKGIRSGSWWDSVLPLQERWRLGLSVSLQRIHTRD